MRDVYVGVYPIHYCWRTVLGNMFKTTVARPLPWSKLFKRTELGGKKRQPMRNSGWNPEKSAPKQKILVVLGVAILD